MTKKAGVALSTFVTVAALGLGPQPAHSAHTSCPNTFVYDDGANTIVKDDACQIIYSQGGADDVHTRGGQDDIYAGAGNDYAEGEADHDNLYGNEGNDKLAGRAGNDHVQDIQWNTGDSDTLCGDYGIDFLDMADGDTNDLAFPWSASGIEDGVDRDTSGSSFDVVYSGNCTF